MPEIFPLVFQIKKNVEEYELGDTCASELFTQSDISDLIRDLHLTKNNLDLLGSILKGKDLLAT